MQEIGSGVCFEDHPLKIIEFIILGYKFVAPDGFRIVNKGLTMRDQGYLRWSDDLPDDLYPGHGCYMKIWKDLKET